MDPFQREREKFIFRPIDFELALIQRNEFDGAENNYGIRESITAQKECPRGSIDPVTK